MHHTGSFRYVKTHLFELLQGIRRTMICAESTHRKTLESILLMHYDVITKTSEAVVDFLQQ